MNVDNFGILYCYNHPKKETHLRCNKCERPICASCAVLTPTGYRCKECIRGQLKVFDTARWWDYPVAFTVAFVVSLLGSEAVGFIGYFTIILSFLVGIAVAESVRFVVRKRRARTLPLVMAIGAFLGGLVLHLSTFSYIFLGYFQNEFLGLLSLLWPVIYAVIVAVTAFYRLKGTRL